MHTDGWQYKDEDGLLTLGLLGRLIRGMPRHPWAHLFRSCRRLELAAIESRIAGRRPRLCLGSSFARGFRRSGHGLASSSGSAE